MLPGKYGPSLPGFIFICGFLLFIACQPLFNPAQAESSSAHNGMAKLKAIIQYGALAPSTHNAQMWQLKILSEREIIVMRDQTRALPRVDPDHREAFISLGAFIENMVEAAPAFGLTASVQILASNPAATEVARITFRTQTSPANTGRVLENIKNRHTLRIPYLKKALSDQDLAAIFASSRYSAYFPLASREGQYLKTAIIESARQQVFNDPKQDELAGWIRFSKKEADAAQDGLTPEMMGLSGIVKWFVSVFYNRNTVLGRSFRNQTIAAARKQAENCAGFVILTSPDNSAESWLNAGRSLEEFLIKTTERKIAVQPMSSPLEESPWRESLGPEVGLTGTVQMILRIGYVNDFGKPVSQRREVVFVEP